MGDRFSQPQAQAPKFYGACGTSEFLHIGLYNGRDLSNTLAPREGGGGGLGSGPAPGHPPCGRAYPRPIRPGPGQCPKRQWKEGPCHW